MKRLTYQNVGAAMKCENFCNWHCSTTDCPNIQCDEFEEYWDVPAEDTGLERIKCKDCRYNDKHCGCDDCYFKSSKECPEYDGGEPNER